LGLRQAVMALMDWAIDVPQELGQSDAKLFLPLFKGLKPHPFYIKESYKWLKDRRR